MPGSWSPISAALRSIEIVRFSLEDEIKSWMDGHGGSEPYGAHPDAKVMAVAKTLPAGARVLDVGAGNGRNALPLARLGFAVEALERAEVFVCGLRATAEATGLPLRVLASDLFAPDASLVPERYDLILLSEVFTHFTLEELENALAKLGPALAPSGRLLCNAFLWHAADEPERVARHAGKTLWATFFTRPEMLSRFAEAGVELVSDETAAAYEQENLPPEAWPPNKWFEGWAKGNNVFDERFGPAPVELRWLLLRRADARPVVGAHGERA